MNSSAKLFLKFILIFISIVGVLFSILNFRNNNGDPLINLVFSKSFVKGFFYYGNEGPKSGSTSPLFVMLMTPFYLFSELPPLIVIKIFYLLIYLASACFLVSLGIKIFHKNEYASYFILAFYLGNIYFGYLSATLYDSILLFLVLIIFYYILIDVNRKIKERKMLPLRESILLGICGSLSLMARPDSIIALIISYIWLYKKVIANQEKNYIRNLFISTLVIILVGGGFYLFLGIQTGHLIPTSVLARATLRSNGFINNFIKIFTSRFWVYYLLFVYLFLCLIVFLLRRRIEIVVHIDRELFNLFFSTIILYLPIFFYSGEARYISAAFPSIILISVSFPVYLLSLDNKLLTKTFIVLISCFTVFYVLYAYKVLSRLTVYSEDIIIERELCEIVNKIAKPTDKIAVYEIQSQYCLNPQTLSLDGIVGGEILPYFKKKSNLIDFLLVYKPAYLVLSDYVLYRLEFGGTILEKLYFNDGKLKVGDTYTENGISFFKIAENKNKNDFYLKLKGMRFWLSLYKLKYE